MVHRATLVWTVAALGALVGSTLSAYASSPPTVSVGGEVQFPTSYTPALLAALPQTTATVTVAGRQYTDTGVLLETLVSDAGPAFPSSITNLKNRVLRVTATVRGSGREVTFAVGELDPSFGNHQALLALTQNGAPIDGGPQLVVPGDRNPARFVPSVSQVEVGIATAPATNTQPAAASPVTLHTNGRQVSLTPALRAHLASETLTVSFGGPTGEQTHTEIGPPLINVLALAGAGAGATFNTWAAAVGDDNYVAVVTPGEQLVGGRMLQLSLNEDGTPLPQPRLVPDGDVKGGRYVSGVVDIYAGTGPAR